MIWETISRKSSKRLTLMNKAYRVQYKVYGKVVRTTPYPTYVEARWHLGDIQDFVGIEDAEIVECNDDTDD